MRPRPIERAIARANFPAAEAKAARAAKPEAKREPAKGR